MKKRPDIFFCVGVRLRGHERVPDAGVAMLTWFWANSWTVEYDRSGFVPASIIPTFVAPANDLAHAETLVECGLFKKVEGGYRIVNFEVYNQTTKERAEAKVAAKERAAASRARSRAVHPDEACGARAAHVLAPQPHVRCTYAENDGVVPASASASSSSDPENQEDPETAREGAPELATPTVTPATDHFGAHLLAVAWADGVSAVTGRPCTAPRAPWDRQALDDVARAEGLRGNAASAWMRDAAAAYTSREEGAPTVKRFANWFNGGKVGYRAPSPSGVSIKASPGRAVAPSGDERVLTGTELASAADALLASLGCPSAPVTDDAVPAAGGVCG